MQKSDENWGFVTLKTRVRTALGHGPKKGRAELWSLLLVLIELFHFHEGF